MLREITKDDLDTILRWRNSPDVRKVMFSDHEITEKEHQKWWNNLSNNSSKKALIFSNNEIDCGVVNYFDIDNKLKNCHWGFFLSNHLPSNIDKLEIWLQLEKEAIEFAFSNLGCNNLICETFEFNKPVIEIHKRFGFVKSDTIYRLKENKKSKVIVTELKRSDYYKESTKKGINESSVKAEINTDVEYCRLKKNIVFLSKSNVDFLSKQFIQTAKKYNIDAKVTNYHFGNYMLDVNDPLSDLRREKIDFLFFLETMESFIDFGSVFSLNNLDLLSKQWDDYLKNIKLIRAKINGIIFIGTPVFIESFPVSANLASEENKRLLEFKSSLEKKLVKFVETIENTYTLDLNHIIQRTGRNKSNPSKYKYLARAPFSFEFNRCLIDNIIGLILSLNQKTARVIALDLDNTLWGGVIGDDGINGIQLGGDYPGNVFRTLQALFLSIKERGFLLVVCSKNTESIAIDAIESHPEMLISMDDLVTYKINWMPKINNMREISSEIGINIDSICFIDDSPVERNEVRYFAPEVFVPELPEEISSWPEYIINLPELTMFNITDEDKSRSESYKIRSKINEYTNSTLEREKYLSSLEMSLSFEPCSKTNSYRILQLINKTNQFNTTTKRYNTQEFEKIIKDYQCFGVRLIDNAGSDEIIGVIILNIESTNCDVDSFLLSCRVLGREIEAAILAWLCKYLSARNIRKLSGKIIPTKRNDPVLDLYSKYGFREKDNLSFELNLKNEKITKPSWIAIDGEMN
jgi:UDP-4-amino-4,6-dideoxy-N-acetyl-beta-L-altrosamine N-acetyltransferase